MIAGRVHTTTGNQEPRILFGDAETVPADELNVGTVEVSVATGKLLPPDAWPGAQGGRQRSWLSPRARDKEDLLKTSPPLPRLNPWRQRLVPLLARC